MLAVQAPRSILIEDGEEDIVDVEEYIEDKEERIEDKEETIEDEEEKIEVEEKMIKKKVEYIDGELFYNEYIMDQLRNNANFRPASTVKKSNCGSTPNGEQTPRSQIEDKEEKFEDAEETIEVEEKNFRPASTVKKSNGGSTPKGEQTLRSRASPAPFRVISVNKPPQRPRVMNRTITRQVEVHVLLDNKARRLRKGGDFNCRLGLLGEVPTEFLSNCDLFEARQNVDKIANDRGRCLHDFIVENCCSLLNGRTVGGSPGIWDYTKQFARYTKQIAGFGWTRAVAIKDEALTRLEQKIEELTEITTEESDDDEDVAAPQQLSRSDWGYRADLLMFGVFIMFFLSGRHIYSVAKKWQ